MRLAVLAPDLSRGVRAAIATVVPFYLALACDEPWLSSVALGGWLASLADPGGTRTRRAIGMAAFTLLGGLAITIGGAAAAVPWLAALCVAAFAFAAAIARGLGGNASGIANIVVIAATIAATKSNEHPVQAGLLFAAGSVWAVALSSIAIPIWPHLPVRRALALAYRELAVYARVTAALARDDSATETHWSEATRTHQRAIRAAIEAAREMMVASRARRTGESPVGTNLRLLLGDAEAQFFKLVALGAHLEIGGDPRELDDLAALYDAIDSSVLSRRAAPEPVLATSGKRVAAAAAAFAIARDLDVVTVAPGPPAAHGPMPTAIRDELSLRSPNFRHGLRVGATAALAIVLARAISPDHASWIAVTAIAVLQPYLGPTLERMVERLVGTVLGGALAVGVMAVLHAPLALALVMMPLAVAAVVTRPRSYRLFVVFLTPIFLLVADHWQPDSGLALVRIADVALGGAIAFVAALVVPSTERRRLPDALVAVLDALAAYVGEDRRAELHARRRAVGIALEGAEASLERMLAEPRRLQHGAEPAMFLVTYGRRLSAALTAITELGDKAMLTPEVRSYVLDALAAAKDFVRTGAVVLATEPPEVAPRFARLVHFAELVRETSYARFV